MVAAAGGAPPPFAEILYAARLERPWHLRSLRLPGPRPRHPRGRPSGNSGQHPGRMRRPLPARPGCADRRGQRMRRVATCRIGSPHRAPSLHPPLSCHQPHARSRRGCYGPVALPRPPPFAARALSEGAPRGARPPRRGHGNFPWPRRVLSRRLTAPASSDRARERIVACCCQRVRVSRVPHPSTRRAPPRAVARPIPEEEPPMASRATRAEPITDDYEDDNLAGDDRGSACPPVRKGNRQRRAERRPGREPRRDLPPGRRGPSRAARQGTESFKCGHCRAFIGPTIGGGRHRNHCPLCLYSRHVDDRRPGDRAGACRSLMAPVARFDRPGVSRRSSTAASAAASSGTTGSPPTTISPS